MQRSTREALLDAATAELRALELAADTDDVAHRERLATLVEHLRRRIPSPLVFEAVASLKRRTR